MTSFRPIMPKLEGEARSGKFGIDNDHPSKTSPPKLVGISGKRKYEGHGSAVYFHRSYTNLVVAFVWPGLGDSDSPNPAWGRIQGLR